MRILSSVFLIEIFELRGNELKYAKKLLLNHHRKSVHNSMKLQDFCVELKHQSRTTYLICLQVVYTRQHNAKQQPK